AETAAPVTKAILEAALAAKNAALDRTKLASSEAVAQVDSDRGVKQAGRAGPLHQIAQAETAADLSSATRPPSAAVPSPPEPFVVTLPARPAPAPPRAVHAVPDIHGLGLRDAVRSLHSAGFRVQLARGSGQPSTSPASGELAPTGTLVRLLYDY
ncbi:MAG TPA: hypothetical protein VN600_09825, partial [Gemmatimonadaceae bacterium]|nr:hypothetical protein [Gemmatimonadaceae bacterium]